MHVKTHNNKREAQASAQPNPERRRVGRRRAGRPHKKMRGPPARSKPRHCCREKSPPQCRERHLTEPSSKGGRPGPFTTARSRRVRRFLAPAASRGSFTVQSNRPLLSSMADSSLCILLYTMLIGKIQSRSRIFYAQQPVCQDFFRAPVDMRGTNCSQHRMPPRRTGRSAKTHINCRRNAARTGRTHRRRQARADGFRPALSAVRLQPYRPDRKTLPGMRLSV